MSDASPIIFSPARPTVHAFESKVLATSNILTVSPTAGLDGSVTVRPPLVVSKKIACPAVAVTLLLVVTV